MKKSNYAFLFDRFSSTSITRTWNGLIIRQSSAGLFCLRDVLESRSIELTDPMMLQLKDRWGFQDFARTFDGDRWQYWVSLAACLSVVALSEEVRDRMKAWEMDKFGIIDRFC